MSFRIYTPSESFKMEIFRILWNSCKCGFASDNRTVSLVCGVCAVHCCLFTCPLGVIGFFYGLFVDIFAIL